MEGVDIECRSSTTISNKVTDGVKVELKVMDWPNLQYHTFLLYGR